MSIQISSQLTQRSYSWTNWKSILSTKGGVYQYDDDGTVYTVYFYDHPEVYISTIWKSVVPDGIVAGGYSQVQNDLDKTDFTTNYLANANKRIARTDAFGNPVTNDFDFYASTGQIPGVTVSRATGYVGTSAAAGAAIRATVYTPQGTNAQRSIKSSSVNDTSAGTGARTVTINYLNTSFQLKSETITLNGTTAVNTVSTDIAFIENIIVSTVGTTGGGNAGTISLFTGLAGAGSAWASIAASDNTTYYAHHYVRAGFTCYLLNVSGGSTTVAGAVTINHSGNPSATNLPQLGIGGTYPHLAAGNEDHEFTIPVAIAGPDLIWLVERPNAATASTAYGTFEYVEF